MDKTLQLLSLVRKANKLITGEEFVTDAIRNKKVFLVFLANDAGVNTTKKIIHTENKPNTKRRLTLFFILILVLLFFIYYSYLKYNKKKRLIQLIKPCFF